MAALALGCAQLPEAPPAAETRGEPLSLPGTYVNTPGCPGCLAVTLALRADGSYLVRERVGESEFYDFGRWTRSGDTLELVGGRDLPRRYLVRGAELDSQGGTQGGDLKPAPAPEALRGPFRLVGLYDGASFRECRTGLAWRLSATRAAQALKDEYMKKPGFPALVALDAQFEGRPETLRVLRPAALLGPAQCPR